LFSETIKDWQIFFATVAGISATLMGLIFLSLSLRLDALRKSNDQILRQVAWQTFSNFFFLIMFALVFLVPNQTVVGLVLPIFIISLVALSITTSQAIRSKRSGAKLIRVASESAPSLLAYLGMVVVLSLLIVGVTQSLVWLLPIAVIILAVAVRNAWSLLVG
jgi:hypothetical protein